MSSSTFQDSTRYVVDGDHPGGVLPGRRDEMGRDVFLEPGAFVRGGVFGDQIVVSGAPVTVDGAIYARRDVRFEGGSLEHTKHDAVSFSSATSSGGSIVVADDFPARVRFLGDIYGDQVRLQNAFIRGNVFARKAILRDCVVLGGLFVEEDLRLERTALTTFRAGHAKLGERVFLYYPMAFASDRIDMNEAVYSLALAELREAAEEEEGESGVVLLDQSDVVYIREPSADGSETEMAVLSLAMRLLDIEALRKRFQSNLQFIKNIALADHLAGAARAQHRGEDLLAAERRLFNMLDDPPTREVSIRGPIDRIAQREETAGFLARIAHSSAG